MEFVGQNGRRRKKRTVKNPPRTSPSSMIAKSVPRKGSKRWVYWCWGDNSSNRRVAIGSFGTESEAYQQGLTAYPGEFKVYMLDTVNLAAAKTKLKAIDIREGKMIDEAMRRSSSKLP